MFLVGDDACSGFQDFLPYFENCVEECDWSIVVYVVRVIFFEKECDYGGFPFIRGEFGFPDGLKKCDESVEC